jgi:aminoacrylate hydrolase
MPKIAIADGEIHYEESGSGEPLLLVAGLSGVGRYWTPQVSEFSRHYRVITYDQRGTGASDKRQQRYSVDGMAADLVALMDALGIERARLVGQSTGGAIGQTLAIEHPDRVERMVIFSTWTHCDAWHRRLFEARKGMFREVGAELHAQFHPLWLYPPEYVNAHDAELDEERRKAVAGAPPTDTSIARIDAIMGFDRRNDLHRIRTPTLVLCARDDYITPAYHAEYLGRAIPTATVTILPGGGHALSKTLPETFNRITLEYLAARPC